jgi:RimJ/RimL family protein N-acetyltransferase
MQLDGQVVGDLHLDLTDAFSQIEVEEQAKGTGAEIGWVVDPAYAGRGLATEGARELLRICFDVLGVRRVTAGAFADNAASVRIMEKLGMRIESRTVRDALHRDRGWLDGIGAAILAEEWRAQSR